MNYGAIDTQTHCRVLLRDMSAPGLRFSLAACSALYRGELLLGGGARATKPSAPAPTTTSRTVSSTCSKRDGAGVPLDARTWVEIHHRSDPDLTQAYATGLSPLSGPEARRHLHVQNARLGSAPAADPGKVLASVHQLEGQDVPSGGMLAGEQPERSRGAAVSRSGRSTELA